MKCDINISNILRVLFYIHQHNLNLIQVICRTRLNKTKKDKEQTLVTMDTESSNTYYYRMPTVGNSP